MPKQAERRIACLLIEGFAAAVEQARHPDIQGPLLVQEHGRVLGACPLARGQGVREGDALQQAQGRCARVTVLTADRAHYEQVWAQLLMALSQHTPVIESTAPGLAYLDAMGLVPLYASERAWCQALQQATRRSVGLEAQIGLARTKFVAHIAAASTGAGADACIVRGDRAFLEPLPISELQLGAETLRRCKLLGLYTIGQFASLPRHAVAEQFGPEALQVHAWARGLDRRPLSSRLYATLSRRHEFDYPERRAEALHAILLKTGTDLLEELLQRGLAVNWVRMEMEYENGDTQSAAAWLGNGVGSTKLDRTLRSLIDQLATHHRAEPWNAGISDVTLVLTGLEPLAGKQLDLFAHRADRLRLDATLRRLARKYSEATVLKPCVADPHTPILADRYRLCIMGDEP
jgi:nucleotidyltransferase/DNA polymerase involved in DNA repair